MNRAPLAAFGALVCLAVSAAAATAPGDYEIGGPLAGVKLPLFPTQNGEEPGYPGCLRELVDPARADNEGNVPYTAQGQQPELLLYPGAVEHFRSVQFKYVPARSLFDQQSLLKNWVLDQIPGADKKNLEQYSSPVYWNPRHQPSVATGKFLKPVPVVRWKAGGDVFKLDLGNLGVGVYAVRVIGAAETARIQQRRGLLPLTHPEPRCRHGPRAVRPERRDRPRRVEELGGEQRGDDGVLARRPHRSRDVQAYPRRRRSGDGAGGFRRRGRAAAVGIRRGRHGAAEHLRQPAPHGAGRVRVERRRGR